MITTELIISVISKLGSKFNVIEGLKSVRYLISVVNTNHYNCQMCGSQIIAVYHAEYERPMLWTPYIVLRHLVMVISNHLSCLVVFSSGTAQALDFLYWEPAPFPNPLGTGGRNQTLSGRPVPIISKTRKINVRT